MKRRSEKPSVVVEIGSDWLKIAQVETTPAGVSLSKVHLAALEAGAAPTEALAEAFRKLQLSRTPVRAFLPRQMVNIRMLDLPSTDPQEIADMVDLQTSKQTPYSQEEIVSDYRIIGEGRKGYTRVMLAIAQRSMLRQRFYVLEEAGVEVGRMSVSSEGLLHWFRRAAGAAPAPTVVLDVDSFYTDCAVIAGGELVFTKSILVGANQLLEEYGKWKEKFTREVQQALEVCQGDLPGLSPARLIVTGAGARIPDLAADVGAALNLQAEVRDPLQGLSGRPAAASLADARYGAVSLTALIGMGLADGQSGINLVPDSVKMRRSLTAKARELSGLGMLIMAALVSGSLYTTAKLWLREARLARLRQEVRRTDPAVRELERRREVVKAVHQRKDPRLGALNVLATVHAQTADVLLEAVDFNGERDQCTLEGSAVAMKDVSTLVQRLEQTPTFADVTEGRATVKDETTGRFRFQIVCPLEKSP